jgi:hypothetical protein
MKPKHRKYKKGQTWINVDNGKQFVFNGKKWIPLSETIAWRKDSGTGNTGWKKLI